MPPPISEIQLSALNGANGLKLRGKDGLDHAGNSVSGAGDVNGDGFDDIILGAYQAESSFGEVFAGAAYVVFGGSSAALDALHGASGLALSSLNGSAGFAMFGEQTNDLLGKSVAGLGDVNGDGFDDVMVGANHYGSIPFENGAAYVVLGKAAGFSNLDFAMGGAGVKFLGSSDEDFAGRSVAGAGDMNGDGFDDIVFSMTGANANGTNAGMIVVSFGNSAGIAASIGLLNGSNGFVLRGEAVNDYAGRSVKSAGDINGDGFNDLVVGVPLNDRDPTFYDAGAAYVVFGKPTAFASSTILSSANLAGTNGFKISGPATVLGELAISASGAGDINGDGIDDLVVSGSFPTAAYVIFGKTSAFPADLDLASVALDGTNGFRLTGDSSNAVSAAGDVDGDGFDDLIVGAPLSNGPNGGAYVVYGKASGFSSALDLTLLDGNQGFRIVGEFNDGYATGTGVSVSAAGDVNGDGFDDILIGASLIDDPSNTFAGAGYLVFGGNFRSMVDFAGTTGSDALAGNTAANILLGALGNDTLDGGDGTDVLKGGAGSDSLLGGNGLDRLIGGEGNDTLRGNDQADTLYGDDGNDFLGGGKGHDSLDGGKGNDTLAGLVGNDSLIGGTGIDLADYSGSSDGVTVNLVSGIGGSTLPAPSVGSGTDALRSIENILGSAFADNLTGNAGHNALTGGLGNDTLSGDTGFDTLDGGEGNDSLLGGLQKDEVFGGNGDDTVAGGNGFDTIDGGAGNDSIRGALGTDVLTGSSGVDRFNFATALDGLLNIDTITDFVSGTDVIELSAAIFAGLGAVGATVGLSANLTYDSGTGVLQYDADGAGVNPGITFAILGTSIHPAVGSDFFITA